MRRINKFEKILEYRSCNTFCEYVCRIFSRRYIKDVDCAVKYKFSNSVISDVNVFRSIMMYRVFSEIIRRCVVTIDTDWSWQMNS